MMEIFENNPDFLAAILGISMTLPPAFIGPASMPNIWDAFYFSWCIWIPILSLPAIQKGQATLAAAINLLTFIAAFQIKEDPEGIWRPFCAAMACFSTLKAYDLATNYSASFTSARHYCGLLFLVDMAHRKKVTTYIDCFYPHLVDLVSAARIIPLCIFLFGICEQFLSRDYYLEDATPLSVPTNWTDAMLVCCRCSLVGIIFGYGLGCVKLFYQLIFLPYKVVPTQPVMNNILAASSLGEFWSYRWNYPFHSLLKRTIYLPLLKSGKFNNNNNNNNNKYQAQLFTFAFSGLFHAALLVTAGATMTSGPFCLSFFLCQGLLIHLEKKLFPPPASPTKKNDRKGNINSSTGNRIYALLSLFCTAPLLIEPVLKQQQQSTNK